MRLSEGVGRKQRFLEEMKKEPFVLTRRNLEDLLYFGRTPRGAWNQDQLELLGVPWPPKGGWKGRLIARRTHVPSAVVRQFMFLADIEKKDRKLLRRVQPRTLPDSP